MPLSYAVSTPTTKSCSTYDPCWDLSQILNADGVTFPIRFQSALQHWNGSMTKWQWNPIVRICSFLFIMLLFNVGRTNCNLQVDKFLYQGKTLFDAPECIHMWLFKLISVLKGSFDTRVTECMSLNRRQLDLSPGRLQQKEF